MTLGLDTAAVDANSPPDFHAAHAAGARFIYLKKSRHVYPDTFYVRDVRRARDAGLVTGAYHFPGWGTKAASAKTQIAAFKNAPGDIQPGKDLPPALDIEGGHNGFASWGLSKSELVEFIRQLVLEVEDQLGVRPVIYTSYPQFYDLGCPSMPWASGSALWIKTAYVCASRQPVSQDAPREPHTGNASDDPKSLYQVPDPWTKTGWAIQQYQGDALGFPGFNRTVDVNRFNTLALGSKGPFVEWLQRKLSVALRSVPPSVPQIAAPDTSDVHGADPALPLTLVADGDFGPKTDTAVRAFQRAKSLDCDGIVSPATFAALAWVQTSS